MSDRVPDLAVSFAQIASRACASPARAGAAASRRRATSASPCSRASASARSSPSQRSRTSALPRCAWTLQLVAQAPQILDLLLHPIREVRARQPCRSSSWLSRRPHRRGMQPMSRSVSVTSPSRAPLGIHDRQTPDLALDQDPSCLGERRVGADRHDVPRHHLADLDRAQEACGATAGSKSSAFVRDGREQIAVREDSDHAPLRRRTGMWRTRPMFMMSWVRSSVSFGAAVTTSRRMISETGRWRRSMLECSSVAHSSRGGTPPSLTVNTGHGAVRIVRSATLPSSTCLRPVRPRSHHIRSAPSFSARPVDLFGWKVSR